MFPTGVGAFADVIKGNTLTNILNTYFPDPDVQRRIVDLLVKQESDMPYRLFDGALSLMSDLRDNGVQIAVVTSSNLPKMRHLFEVQPRLAALVDVLITDEDVTASKPDPQGYNLAARRLAATEGEYVVIEDSIAGLEAGRRSGAFVLGIATTNPMDKVAPLSDWAVSTISEVSAIELISKINGTYSSNI